MHILQTRNSGHSAVVLSTAEVPHGAARLATSQAFIVLRVVVELKPRGVDYFATSPRLFIASSGPADMTRWAQAMLQPDAKSDWKNITKSINEFARVTFVTDKRTG